MARNGEMTNRGAAPARPFVWGGAAALMLLPVVAIRGTDAAAWDPPGDFVFLAVLLVALGLAYELAARVPDRQAYAAGAGIAAAAALLGAWINLAVGIVGSEDNPANLIFAAPIAVAAAGAVLARLRAAGMALATTAAALAQLLAFAVAFAAGIGFTGPITILFTGLWLVSAWLFGRAAREATAP